MHILRNSISSHESGLPLRVATGTGMTGDDSTNPAPIPANPHTRHPRKALRGQNDSHPR